MSFVWRGAGLGGRPIPDGSTPHRRSATPPPSASSASAQPPQDDDRPRAYEAAIQSPQQRELAGLIYARLKAGSDVDDVRDLIARLRGTVVGQARSANSAQAPRSQR